MSQRFYIHLRTYAYVYMSLQCYMSVKLSTIFKYDLPAIIINEWLSVTSH